MDIKNINHPITTTSGDYRLFWLVTGLLNRPIDLNRMSASANRRDLPAGVSGMFTALNPNTCFLELGFTRDNAPAGTYLVSIDAPLKLGDYRNVPSAQWSGSYYGPSHSYSYAFYSDHSGEMITNECDGFMRYSDKALSHQCKEEVVVLRETALPKLNVVNIEGIGEHSPTPHIKLYGTDKAILWNK